MIRCQNLVPEYYVEKSRDFQVLCRLYDFTLNGLKYNIDTMKSLTDTRAVKDTVLPLVGDKFGIYDKEAYSNRQMLEALPIAIKYKGSLKAVKILLNAFLDSINVFEYAVAYHTKDADSAEEISKILNRTVQPYSIVIILSTFPSLTNLHMLDEFLRMVIPTGLNVEYAFGISRVVLDKFKYKEYTFLFYTHEHIYDDKVFPYIGFVKNTSDKYSASPVFDYLGSDNISNKIEYIRTVYSKITPTKSQLPICYEVKHTKNGKGHFVLTSDTEVVATKTYYVQSNDVVGEKYFELIFTSTINPNKAQSTDPYDMKLILTNKENGETSTVSLQHPITTDDIYKYTFDDKYLYSVSYYYNKTKEFIEEVTSDVDVNAVGIATIVGNSSDE